MGLKKSRYLARLRDLCAMDLPSTLLMPTVLAELHSLVASSRNLFDWCDAQGRLTQYYIEGPVDQRIAQLYFEQFHNQREREVMTGFTQAVCGPAKIHSAQELNTRRFFNSALYAEIWRPQGLRYRVEAVVRGTDLKPLGSLVLYRAPGERCFTPAEEALLAQAIPYLAQALQRDAIAQSHHPSDWVLASDRTETLLLQPSGKVCHASAGAQRLLSLSEGGLYRSRSSENGCSVLHDICAEMAHRDRCCRDVLSQWGLFRFDAQWLHALEGAVAAPRFIQVQIARHEPRQLADDRRLFTLGLSIGQAAVCRLLLQGLPQTDVALRLGVAPSTVVDHTRKLYRRLGVRSVQDLVKRMRVD